jgi:RNase H-like domain found in reverse transcriptase/Reverse transcriptase (RNA-dependent DNA polymerase)
MPEPSFSSMMAETLDPPQRAALEKLLQEFTDVFAWTDDQLGFTDKIKHSIPLTSDIPVALPYRRLPPTEFAAVKEHIESLTTRGIIQPSTSPYAAPMVIVKKKNGEIRLCCDYRRLNGITRKDAFPLPRIDETLDALAGSTFFSTLDLASGYHQVAMAEEDQEKTAFVTPFGLYQWTRMPFGLCGAVQTFSRLMQGVMSEHIMRIMLAYLDDILIYAPDFTSHLANLRTILARLRDIGLKLNPEKCVFGAESVHYLGHVVSKDGVKTDPGKITAISEWQPPKTLKELRSFLGLASYYRRFVKGFANIAQPLHQVVTNTHEQFGKRNKRQDITNLWGPEQQSAFNRLKTALTTTPVLGYPDFTLPFILETDASSYGLGAVLSQKQADGVKVIAFASRSLRVNEKNMKNYSALKLELLALKWAMAEKFRGYLLGSKTLVLTDNNPLSYIKSSKTGATEHRWIADLDVFDFEVKYRSGKSNANADALSRFPVDKPAARDPEVQYSGVYQVTTRVPPEVAISTPQPVPLEAHCNFLSSALPADVKNAQQVDSTIQEILPFLTPGHRLHSSTLSLPAQILLRQKSRLRLKDGILQRTVKLPGQGKSHNALSPINYDQRYSV